MKPHLCVDCLKLLPEVRPKTPRPAPHGGPRSRRCFTHWRAKLYRTKTQNHARYVTRTYGIDEDDQEALWEFQGRRCACGRQPSRKPDTDHNHHLARQHDHPPDKACPECIRGLLCRYCNKYILGMGYNADMLERLAAYLRDPPYQRMRRTGL